MGDAAGVAGIADVAGIAGIAGIAGVAGVAGVVGIAGVAGWKGRMPAFTGTFVGMNFRSWRRVACLFPHLSQLGRFSHDRAM